MRRYGASWRQPGVCKQDLSIISCQQGVVVCPCPKQSLPRAQAPPGAIASLPVQDRLQEQSGTDCGQYWVTACHPLVPSAGDRNPGLGEVQGILLQWEPSPLVLTPDCQGGDFDWCRLVKAWCCVVSSSGGKLATHSSEMRLA